MIWLPWKIGDSWTATAPVCCEAQFPFLEINVGLAHTSRGPRKSPFLGKAHGPMYLRDFSTRKDL